MPILNPNDQLIERLSLFDEQKIVSPLPSPAEAAATYSDNAKFSTERAFQRDQIANWANGFQQLSGSVLQRVGAPQGDLTFGDDLFNGLLGYVKIEDPSNAALQAIAIDAFDVFIDAALDYLADFLMDLLGDVIDPLIQMVGAIPIYGWIIEAIWDVAFGIVRLVRLVKEQNAPEPDKEYEAAQFSPSADASKARYMVSIIRDGTDWTNVFRPEGIGKSEAWYSANFFGEKLIGGVGYRVTSAGPQEQWVGMVPGSNTIADGYEIYTSGGMANRTLGNLFPSARYLGVSIWDQINLNSPSMFCVDAISCRNLWRGHLQQLREHLYEHDIPGRKAFVDGLGKNLFNWSSWDAGKTAYEKLKADGYQDWETYLDELGVSENPLNPNKPTPASVCETLYKRQLSYINTTACAYVDPKKYGAFLGDPQLQPETKALLERAENNRMLLKQHPARCTVDLSSIPDSGYRFAMETAQENCLPAHLGQIKLPELDPNAPKPPPVDQIPLGAKLRPLDPNGVKDHVRRGGKLTPLLLLGGAVGVLWARKRGMFR